MDGGTTIINEYNLDDSRIVERLETLSAQVEEMQVRLDESVTVQGELEGCAIFGVTIVLCVFVYKFFRMFL